MKKPALKDAIKSTYLEKQKNCHLQNGSLFSTTSHLLKLTLGGFPGDPMDKNLPANAMDPGFNPWSRKIPHAIEGCAPQLLSLRSRDSHNRACMLQRLKPSTTPEPDSATREATATRNPCTATKRSPHSLWLEKALVKQ